MGGLAWLASSTHPPAALAANRAAFLFALCILNAVFASTQAWNSWAIHQNGRYVYAVLGARLREIAEAPVRLWDEWRRREQGAAPGIDNMRSLFGLIQTLTNVAVSGGLFLMAASWGGLSGALWWLAGGVTGILTIALFTYPAVVVANVEDQWKLLIDDCRRLEGR